MKTCTDIDIDENDIVPWHFNKHPISWYVHTFPWFEGDGLMIWWVMSEKEARRRHSAPLNFGFAIEPALVSGRAPTLFVEREYGHVWSYRPLAAGVNP